MFKLQRLEITGFKSFADYTEIVFTGSGITAVVGPNGCGKCVDGSTLVTLSDGREFAIRELVDAALDNCFFKEQFDDGFLTRENPRGVEILSLNPQTLKLEPRRIAAFIKRETTGKILHIRTRAGREIKATPYHPLFTLENGELRTLRADELKTGLRIAVPRLLPTRRKEVEFSADNYLNAFEADDNIFVPYSDSLKSWSEAGKNRFGTLTEWAQTAAVSRNVLSGLRGGQSINIAELNKLSKTAETAPPFVNQISSKRSGALHLPEKFSTDLARLLGLLIAEGRNTATSQVWFINSDAAVNREFERLAKTIFGVRVSQNEYKKGTIDSLVYSQSLCRTLEKIFNFPINSNSFEKECPPQIFEADEKTKWAFLSGLFEGDAHVCSRPQKSSGKHLNYIEYATASEKLARQVISLLLQLGVTAYLRPKNKYAANTIEKKNRRYFSVLIYGSRQLKSAADNLQFVGAKRESLERLKSIAVTDNPNRDLVPGATAIVREAVKLARVKVKPNRQEFPKIAAYTGKICEASRNGLNEVVGQIKRLSANFTPAENALNKLSMLANSDVFWDEIVEVREVEPTDRWVYDLSVNETHNFVAGNIIVHNSNVSDSIAWVLGEQKAKSLRGEEMKDVVFQGTSKRRASGMAEVVLHLVRDEESFFADEESELEDIDETLSNLDENAIDVEEIEAQNAEPGVQNSPPVVENGNGFHTGNSEEYEVERVQAAQIGSIQTVEKKIKTKRHWKPRAFALDFAPGEAVSVTRRLYLSGESEYLLNGKTCRLRDIQDLFAGTGLSGAHYALIEQGRIGQILSAKPSDRRSLIEEAAGISKFRTRQRAAETRLESAKTNLSRITDIVSEIEKQTNALRRQAAKTRRYKILREEFRQMLRQTFAAEGRSLSDLVGELEEKFKEAEKLERAVFWEVAEKDEAFRAATQNARRTEENLTELRARHSENALTRDRSERERQYKKEQIGNLNERSGALKAEVAATEERLKLILSETKRLEKEERQERAAAEQSELDLRAAENEYHEKLKQLNDIETRLETERAAILQHTAAFERLTEIGRQLENTSERLQERAEGLIREGKRANEIYAEHRKNAGRLEKTLEKERDKLKNLQAEKQAMATESAAARDALRAQEQNLNDARGEFQRKQNRLETLQELEAQKTIYAPTVQKLFAEQKRFGVKFAGTLADRLDVDERAEKAVENLLGNYLQTILVETETDARKIIKFLNENNLGRAAILVQSSKTKDQRPKTKDQIINFLGAPEDLAATLTEIFPREMAAKLKDNLDDAKSQTDEILLSLNGDLNVGGKFFVGGKSSGGEKSASLLAFKRELRELAAVTQKLGKAVEKAEQENGAARENLAEKENNLVDLQSLIVKVEREMLSSEMQSKSLAQEVERAERHQRVVGEESKQVEKERQEIETRRREAALNAGKANEARDAAAAKSAKISSELNEAREALSAENAVLNEKRTAAATSGERRRAAQTTLRRIENERVELAARIARHDAEISETAGKTKDLENSVAQIENNLTRAATEQTTEQKEIAEMAAQLKMTRETADAAAAELAELNRKSAEARNERAAVEIKQAEAVTRLKNLNEKSHSELNLSLVELVESEPATADDFDLETARQTVEDLRDKIENFGAINMLALEELSETEERFTFLTAQRQDIVDGIAAAESALKEIKQRSRDKFKEAFYSINRNFAEFFQELFGGGRGEMTLLEAEDVLEAGIEIVAQPPGKRLQSILLLSGGEKAMTAIALVMAIFQYRPAPFCLLDEVDAPLDDANVGRFVNKIAEMSEKTQFIVITHNKRTMEAAKALYGVTMQEAGVSKVVSVRFE